MHQAAVPAEIVGDLAQLDHEIARAQRLIEMARTCQLPELATRLELDLAETLRWRNAIAQAVAGAGGPR